MNADTTPASPGYNWLARSSREVLDCAGRAQRRRRFRMTRDVRERDCVREKSGVASDLPPQSKSCALRTTQRANPEGIASSSPGLRGTSYPGYGAQKHHNPERVASRVAHRVGDPMDTTPLGLIASAGLTQGSSSLATLGLVAESLRDSTNHEADLWVMVRSKTLARERLRLGGSWPQCASKVRRQNSSA
jgi:hypothetical protein